MPGPLHRKSSSPAPLALLASLLSFGCANAQYIYMDANGDGVHTSADRLSPSDTTRIDIWLCTDHNRDDSPVDVACPGGGGWTWKGPQLSVMGFAIRLRATNGTVSWGRFELSRSNAAWQEFRETRRDTMEFSTSFTDKSVGRSNLLAPGKLRLGTLDVTVRSGTPSLSFVPGSSESPAGGTCYFTPCLGKTFSSEVCLGRHWADADTLAFGGRANQAPKLTEIPWLNVDEGGVLDQPVEASDEDGQALQFEKAEGPPFLSIRSVDPGQGRASAVIRLEPGFCDAGVFEGRVRVSDGLLSASQAFHVTVWEVPRPREANPLEAPPASAADPIAHGTRRIDPNRDSTWIRGDWEWATESGWKRFGEVCPVDVGRVRRLIVLPGNHYEYYEGLPGNLQLLRTGRFVIRRVPNSSSFEVDSLEISQWQSRYHLRSAGPDTFTLYPSGVTDANEETYVRVGDARLSREPASLHKPDSKEAEPVSITSSDPDRWIFLPEWVRGMMKRHDRRMEIFRPADFAKSATDSYAVAPHQAPSAVVGDFDGDFRPDAVLYVHDRQSAHLIGVVSDHGRYRLVEFARSREAGQGSFPHGPLTHVLKHVPRGTVLPPCDGKHLYFGTDGVQLAVADGSSYFYYFARGAFHEFVPGN